MVKQRKKDVDYGVSSTSLVKGREVLFGASHRDDDVFIRRTSSMSTVDMRDDSSSEFTSDDYRIGEDETYIVECCTNARNMENKSSIKLEQNISCSDVNSNIKMTKRMIYSCQNKRIETIASPTTNAENNIIAGATSTFSPKNIKISNKNEIQTKNINVFLFLMDLQTEAFDIIQVSLPTSNDNGRIKSILTNLILLHTSTSRNNVMINTSAITAQNYTGLCRPLNDMDIISETSCDVDQDIFRIDPNEILVPIPDYSNNHDCSVASQNIIQMHKHIITKILHQMR